MPGEPADDTIKEKLSLQFYRQYEQKEPRRGTSPDRTYPTGILLSQTSRRH